MSDNRLVKAALKIVQSDDNRFSLTKAHEVLIDRGYGERDGRFFKADQQNKEAIKAFLKHRFNITDWTVSYQALTSGSRTQAAALSNQEKLSNKTTKGPWIKLKALTPGCQIKSAPFPSLPGHLEIKETDLPTIDADWLLVIENSETFYDIDTLILSESLPDRLIAVYRGDPQSGMIAQFLAECRATSPIKVMTYFDCDPAGFEMANKVAPDAIIVPDLFDLTHTKGSFELFTKQAGQLLSLDKKNNHFTATVEPWLAVLRKQTAFTQEMLMANKCLHRIVAVK